MSAPLTNPSPCSSLTAAARRKPLHRRDPRHRGAEQQARQDLVLGQGGLAGERDLGIGAGPCSATVTVTSAVVAVAARSIIGTGGLAADEVDGTAVDGEAAVEQVEVAAADVELALDQGIGEIALERQLPGPLRIEAAPAHEQPARNVEADVEGEVERCRRLGGLLDRAAAAVPP